METRYHLEQIADISVRSGPAQVSRENTKRRITVGFNVRNRDIQSVINDVSAAVDAKVRMPTGYYISYGGQFKNLEAAQKRLAIAVPVALLLIFILLYFTFNSVKQSLLIFTAVPMSAIGGIVALWLRGMNFSISAGVGFIALFGVAVLNGIVLIAEFNRLEKEGVADITERVLKGLHTRLATGDCDCCSCFTRIPANGSFDFSRSRGAKTTCNSCYWRPYNCYTSDIAYSSCILYFLYFR